MIESGRNVMQAELSADVCVIGAGPAGIIVASELSRRGVAVVLLEAGGLPYDRERWSNIPRAILDHLGGAQSMTRGRSIGETYFPLRLSRVRGIGGSTNALRAHGLRCRPLDAVDFADHGDGAWPLPFAEVARYFDSAAEWCGVESPESFDERSLAESELARRLHGDRLSITPFQHGPRDAFTGGMLELEHGDTRVLTDTAVSSIRRPGSHDRVEFVEARALRGPSFRVRASRFVLACGGIDNARLLLASRELHSALGEASNELGRSFMEHLHFVAGFLRPSSEDAAAELKSLLVGQSRHIALAPELNLQRRLLRMGVAGIATGPHSLSPAVRAAGELSRLLPEGPFALGPRMRQARKIVAGLPAVAKSVRARMGNEQRETVFVLSAMAEQAPDRDSRVLLSSRDDRAGLPLADLDWRISDRDLRDARETLAVIASAMVDEGLGTVEVAPFADRDGSTIIRGGWHHMGTTRMGADASDGVVDIDGRVHGLSNLYVAGSSVFPTGGFANPTFTIAALAVRLAEHLGSPTDASGVSALESS